MIAYWPVFDLVKIKMPYLQWDVLYVVDKYLMQKSVNLFLAQEALELGRQKGQVVQFL